MDVRPAWIPVVAVALVDAGGRVLLQQRRPDGRHGGLWEFPGGKVELGETPEQALVREIREELGIELGALRPGSFSDDVGSNPAVRDPHLILLYVCRHWSGVPRPIEAAAIAWLTPAEMVGLAMPPLDLPLVEALPGLLAIA